MANTNRNTLCLFFILTFSLTWGLVGLLIFFTDSVEKLFGEVSASNPLFMLAVYAPAISSLFLIWATYGKNGVIRFLHRLFMWRMGVGWWSFLIFGIPFIFYLGAFFKGANHSYFPFESWSQALPALMLAFFLGPIEELGWRGLALPLLQKIMLPIWAGLVLGVIWAIWHIPAFLMSGAPQSGWSFSAFFIGVVALSVILTPIFNESRGSLFIAYLYHFQMMNPIWPDAQPYDSYLLVMVALVTVWLKRASLFSSDSAVKDVLAK